MYYIEFNNLANCAVILELTSANRSYKPNCLLRHKILHYCDITEVTIIATNEFNTKHTFELKEVIRDLIYVNLPLLQ